MNTISIQSPNIVLHNGMARISSQLVFPDKMQDLWFECDAAYVTYLSPDTCDAFVVSTLLVAMQNGFDIVVEGKMSSKLFYNISQYYMELLALQIRGLKKITIEVSQLTHENWGGSSVFTGFSAGIDSFCTLIDHSGGRVSPEYEVTHFLFNNIGSHGQRETDHAVFLGRLANLDKVAKMIGVPIIAVNSNLDSILKMNFQLTHSIRNTVIPLLFQRICGKFLYSSAYHYADIHVGKTYDMAYTDAICMSLLSTETTECLSVGGQYTRFEKTERISLYQETFKSLDVCVKPSSKTNCSECWKCLRTELTFEILGVLDNYREVFNLDAYRKIRWLFLCDVLGSKDPLLHEIVKAIKERGFSAPFSARLMARVFPNSVIVFVRKVFLERNFLEAYWLIRTAAIKRLKMLFIKTE